MSIAKKTKKDIEREVKLTGTYVPDFSEGDYLVSLRIKSLNKVKRPNILEVLEVLTPFGDGLPSYRIWSELKGKRTSTMCHQADVLYRKMTDLEAAVFLD